MAQPIPSTRRGKLPTKNYVPQKKHQKKRRRRLLWVILACVAVLIAIPAAVSLPYLMPGARQEKVIRIPDGADRNMLSDTLTRYFGQTFADKVTAIVPVDDDGHLKRTGAYLITKGMSPLRAAYRITRGAQQPVRLTINGFRNADQMLRRIAMKTSADAKTLREILYSEDFLKGHKVTREQALGLFIDDTYEVYYNASPEEILQKLTGQYDDVWDSTRRKKAEALGLTPEQVMIIASIVDEESNKLDEKGKIGRLYINRFKKGMKLQADPTVRFALGDFSIRRVLGKHTQVDSPYNTYKVEGLPPGPIRTVAVTTIDAVLDSQPSDYLYMCAKEDFSGYHNFATNYEEHQANARRYQNALNARGIK